MSRNGVSECCKKTTVNRCVTPLKTHDTDLKPTSLCFYSLMLHA